MMNAILYLYQKSLNYHFLSKRTDSQLIRLRSFILQNKVFETDFDLLSELITYQRLFETIHIYWQCKCYRTMNFNETASLNTRSLLIKVISSMISLTKVMFSLLSNQVQLNNKIYVLSDSKLYFLVVCLNSIDFTVMEMSGVMPKVNLETLYQLADKTNDNDYKLRYKRINKIGEGTYAVVYLGNNYVGEEVAIKKFKVISGNSVLDYSALREMKYLKEINHNNIIKLLDVFIMKPQIHIVLEYLNGIQKDQQRIKRSYFRVADIKRWMITLLKGMDYLHKHFIIHIDLKPGNLLLNEEGILKIAAHELLFGSTNYTNVIDMWAIGCIFAELMLRMSDFLGESDLNQIMIIYQTLGSPTEEEWPFIIRRKNYYLIIQKQMNIHKLIQNINFVLLLMMQSIFYQICYNIILQKDSLLNKENQIEALQHPYFTNLPINYWNKLIINILLN